MKKIVYISAMGYFRPSEKTYRDACEPLMEGRRLSARVRTAYAPSFSCQHGFTIKRALKWLFLLSVTTGLAALAEAGIVTQQTGQNTAFTVATNDLLQTGLSSVSHSLTINTGENNAAGGFNYTVLINGIFGDGSSVPINLVTGKQQSVVITSGTITYNLDTSVNVFGYDITNIITYAGWADANRGSQAYTVSYSRVGDSNFTDLVTVTLNHDGFTQEKQSITETTNGLLAANVDAIKFTFPLQEYSGVGYKELDVIGTASAIPDIQQTGQNTAFTVATNDLLETSLSGYLDDLTLNAGENAGAGGNTSVVLNNGVFGAANQTQSVVIASGTITYNLNTSVNVFGYDIISIDTYAGWVNHQRGSQAYTVSYSQVGEVGFTDFAIVTLNQDGFTQEKQSITDAVRGILASGVDAIKFTFPLQEYSGVGYKELDVFGSPVSNPLQVEDVADTIFAVTTPMRGSTDLTLPTVPAGFQLEIKSSSLPGVVATDGTINPPLTNTVVQLVLTLRNIQSNQTADTQTIHLFVPAASFQAPFVSYAKNFTMRRGLFVHWSAPPDGSGNPIVFSDGSRSYTIDEYTSSVDVPAVVNQIVSLGFEYAVITDFHGWQTTLHPCAALDSWRVQGCTSSRDLIGEMIAALKAENVPVYLFTHPVDGYDGYSAEDQARVGWLDSTGNYQRFNDFVNDVYAEMTERYGDDIAGFGFDSEFGMIQANTLGKLDLKRLRNTILSRRPQLSLHGLAGPNDTVELGLKEVWRPNWLDPWASRTEEDYNVETWPAYRRYAGIVQGYHWTTVTPPSGGMARLTGTQMFRYSVLQAGVATEGPGVAWAATPYTDGTWENGVGEAFSALEGLTQPIRESLRGVLPSTSYPRDEGVWLSTLPQGVVATRKPDDTVEYIHVLNHPAGNTLTLPLPADGKRFASASLLRSGHAVQLATNATQVSLTLGPGDTWDANDTVIKLWVEPDSVPSQNLALHKPVDASSSVQFGTSWGTSTPWGYIHLVDGQTSAITATNGWSAGNHGYSSVPTGTNSYEWISVDLETVHWVNSVRMHPRNDGVNLGYGYPVDFEISTSLDGTNWSTAVSVVNQALPVAMETHSFSTRAARYVRIDADQLRANPNEGGKYSFQLAELAVLGFSSLPVLMWNPAQNSMVLEWDNGVLQSTDNLKDVFTDVPAATSPYTNYFNPNAPQRFFRLRY